MSTCTKCPLHEGALHVCVGGRGNAHAPFLVVGQNPGREEDFSGKPFIGRSGKILIEMLKEAGFKGEDVRLTNAVRCLTPKNRPPETDEIEACREYLHAEIHAVRPRAVIALGDVALRALCKTSGIAGKRGKSTPLHVDFGIPELEVWPVYHPAFVLRSPNYRSVVVEDLRRVRNSLLTPDVVPYTEFPVLGNVVAWDIETDFDYDTKTGGENVTQASWSSRDKYGVIQTVVVEPRYAKVPPLLASTLREVVLVTHNGWEFDLPKCLMPPMGRDTMALAWLEDETQPKSLEALACTYAGAVPWKQGQTAPLGSEEFKQYNARDAYWTLRVYEELIKRLGDRVKIADLIILPAFIALKECTRRGIYIDQPKVREFIEKFTKEKAESLTALQAYVGDIQPWCRNAKGELAYKKPTEFNPGSPHQISEYFCHVGIVTKPTESGKDWSSSAEALEQADIPEGFKEPLETYRHAQKMLSTYLEPLSQVGEDGRLHPDYYLFSRVIPGNADSGGTASGRPTASHNVLTLPREFKSVGLYSAPRGKLLAEADYNSVEFRLCAWFAGAQNVLKNYRENPYWDPHKWFAKAFYGLDSENDVTKAMRQIAKSANFSQWYGGYWRTMQEYAAKMGIRLTQETCEKAHAFFHYLIPEAKPWWAANLAFVKRHGYIESPTGRRRHFGRWEDIPYDMQGSVERDATNLLPQSLSHDITMLALGNCHAEGLPINHEWFDAIYFEIDEFEHADQKAQFETLVSSCMIERPLRTLREEFGVDLDVPLTIEFSYKRLEG